MLEIKKIQIHTNFPKCYNFTIIKAQQTYLLVIDSLLNDVISNSGIDGRLVGKNEMEKTWK
jgi:hypothetical protein